MNRLARFLFPPIAAAALMSGLLTLACLGSLALVDRPLFAQSPGLNNCSDTGCTETDSGCPGASDVNCNQNNCKGCAEVGPGPDPFGVCACKKKSF